MSAALEVSGLSVTYRDGTRALREVSLTVAPGERLAVVGASGSGKSTLARAVLGLLPRGARAEGSIRTGGRPGYVAQDPFTACDPLRTVGHHVREAWRAAGLRPPPGAAEAAVAALALDPGALARHPHQWSGGMLQRAAIAAAGALSPALTVADEPTSALDAGLADEVMAALARSAGALLVITHDLRLAADWASRVAVLYEGSVVETGPAGRLLSDPRHPHTRALVAALPAASAGRAAASQGPALVTARHLARHYGGVAAVRDASLSIGPGQVVGVHGRSGSGKSTLLRLLAGLEPPDGGALSLPDSRPGWAMPVFQDARASLDPLWPIWRTITEPLTRLRAAERRARAVAGLASVGLGHLDPRTRPGRLSAGQCQRVAILRAVMARPALIVADEPTSGLDTVAAGQVAGLLRAAADSGTAVVVVSHDLDLLGGLCHDVHLMHDGVILSR
ncbi:ABC transporter ATP-binding protein [Nonomuraea africana]|uniref:ABC transporter ATP-binding protein n=1 Tax=Nonomuraea africana TaxID=46171 RepID=UPI0033CF96F1